MKKLICTLMAAGLLAVPICAVSAYAEESAAEAAEPAAEAGDDLNVFPQQETEINGNTVTIRLLAAGNAIQDNGWEACAGDKGDSSLLELITQSDQEEGCAYAGSFLASDDHDGTETLTIVQKDGPAVVRYITFDFKIEGGGIVEQTGGGYGYPANFKELGKALSGLWVSADDSGLDIQFQSETDDGTFDTTVFEGDSGYYVMTTRYDAIKECLVYDDGFAQGEDADPDHRQAGSILFEGSEDEPLLVWQSDFLPGGSASFKPME